MADKWYDACWTSIRSNFSDRRYIFIINSCHHLSLVGGLLSEQCREPLV